LYIDLIIPISMQSTVLFALDGRLVRLEFPPGGSLPLTTTLLQYLRTLPGHHGTKEGCAEGDCGACTVVLAEPSGQHGLRYRAVDSCLVLLPMLHGKQVITVENLRDSSGTLHPVQRAMVDHYGSQCGYCTPGVVMSLFALYKSSQAPTREEVVDAVAGNLCRCTGYRSIIDAGLAACGDGMHDHFTAGTEDVLGLLRAIPQDGLQLDTGAQRYARPASLAQALHLRAGDPGAVVVCGATDVALRVTKQHERLSSILDISGIPELHAIETTKSGFTFGAAVTMQEVLDATGEKIPALADMLRVFGSRQIRNMATIGGNIGTGSPIGDTLPVLMALRAEVELTGPDGKRQLPVEEVLVGYRKTACRADELITRVMLPGIPRGVLVNAYKISRRHDLDISTVSAAFRLALDVHGNIQEVLLAFGGLAEKTKRALRTEAFLAGKQWSRRAVEEAMGVLAEEFTPLSDVRGSAGFRTTIAGNMLLKFWDDVSAPGDTHRAVAEGA
jgi:xanthine dehydrogenase small subunit